MENINKNGVNHIQPIDAIFEARIAFSLLISGLLNTAVPILHKAKQNKNAEQSRLIQDLGFLYNIKINKYVKTIALKKYKNGK